jgi:hypothetical protein
MRYYGFEFQDPDTTEALEKIRTTPKKVMTGTPWYHVVSNPHITSEMAYVHPNIGEREKVIRNGFPDEHEADEVTMTPESKQRRLEQSSMVMVMLNLAYIPDSVI